MGLNSNVKSGSVARVEVDMVDVEEVVHELDSINDSLLNCAGVVRSTTVTLKNINDIKKRIRNSLLIRVGLCFLDFLFLLC